MKIDKEKNFIQIALTFIIGVICLTALAFYLQKVSINNIGDSIEIGKENGFNLIDFSSDFMASNYSWGAILLGVLCLLQLLVSIITIILSVSSIFIFSKKTTNTINNTCFYFCLFFLTLYMIEGFVFNKIYSDSGYYYKGFNLESLVNELSVSVSVNTLSYIPFILGIVVFIVYVLFIHLRKKQKFSTSNNNNKVVIENDIEILETLKKYKELLDLNIITKEEFDERKNKLLNQ